MSRGTRLVLTAWVAITACLVIAACAPAAAGSRDGIVRIEINTELGIIAADLDSARAPVTVANFLRYVDAGRYTEGTFHRTVRSDNQPRDSVRIAVIQGARKADRATPSFPAVTLERTTTTRLRHRDGALSMARSVPNSATDGFFICIGDQPSLDFGGHRNLDGQGFAAFGHVTKGMDIVRRINASPAEAQNLTPPIRILGMSRVK
ncbi:MAG: peptidylprolyl isomerase [Longimicrobiales bacterium]